MNLEEVNKKLDMMARQQEAFLDRVFSHGLHMAQPQPVGVKSITDILGNPAESLEELELSSRRLAEEQDLKRELVTFFWSFCPVLSIKKKP